LPAFAKRIGAATVETNAAFVKDRVNLASGAPAAIDRGQRLVVNGGWFRRLIAPGITDVSILGLGVFAASRSRLHLAEG